MEFLPLLATLAALLCGPLLYSLGQRLPAFLMFLDGFVVVSIAGLVLLEVLPDSVASGGAWSVAFLILGAVGPAVVEKGLDRARREAHLATLALAIFGLILHSIADGAALVSGHSHGHGGGEHALALAIVVHSVPVGLVIWWVMVPVFGWRLPATTLFLMGAATVGGYVFGIRLEGLIGDQAFAWFQALVAGSILHVVFGRPHLEEDSGFKRTRPPYEGLGNLAALMGLYLLHRIDAHAGPIPTLLHGVWQDFSAISLWYLLGSAAFLLLCRYGTWARELLWGLLVFVIAWCLAGWSLAIAWAGGFLVLSLLGQQSPIASPDTGGDWRSILAWINLSAPPLLFGICLGALFEMMWAASALQWPSLTWQFGIATAIPLILGWNVLAMLPLAAALGAQGFAPGALLTMVLLSGVHVGAPWSRLSLRVVVVVVCGIVFAVFEPGSSARLELLPSAWVPILMLALFAIGLVCSGGRRWAGQVGSGPLAHDHAH